LNATDGHLVKTWHLLSLNNIEIVIPAHLATLIGYLKSVYFRIGGIRITKGSWDTYGSSYLKRPYA
jgi:hypothetical protein